MEKVADTPDWILNPLGLDRYQWTPEMGEISGFGGTYEAGCRAMVQAGLVWMEENTDANPRFEGFEGVYGLLVEDNEPAEELTQAMMDAEFEAHGKTWRVGDEATGAMHHASVTTVLWIGKNGWDAYVEEMSGDTP